MGLLENANLHRWLLSISVGSVVLSPGGSEWWNMTSTGIIFTQRALTWGAPLPGYPGVGQQEPELQPGAPVLGLSSAGSSLWLWGSLAAETKEVWKTFELVSKCG